MSPFKPKADISCFDSNGRPGFPGLPLLTAHQSGRSCFSSNRGSRMRHASLAAAAVAGLFTTPAQAAVPQAAGAPIELACSGPAATAARKIASQQKLVLALDPKACLAQTSMYGGGSRQIVAAAPSATCGPRKAIQIYERSTSGAWGNMLEKPVCGTSVSYGPNNPWGGIMITIDGQHYDQRGAYYTPAKY